jgi:hypothetical protein
VKGEYMIGKYIRRSINELGKVEAVFQIGNEELDKTKEYEIKEYKEKRSLNSNAYLWTLCNEIADILNTSKEEVYLKMLKRYGKSEVISILADIQIKQYLKYYEEFGETLLNGKLFKHYKVFMGSSEMNTKEMSVLLNGIVSEAKEMGIETLEDKKINSMIERWE